MSPAHPAQEPENSSSGCLNWLPLTVVGAKGSSIFFDVGNSIIENRLLVHLAFTRLHLKRANRALLYAESAAHTIKRADSYCKFEVIASLAYHLLDEVRRGRGSGSFFPDIANGRIVACGQTKEHWLHWIHFSLFHSGEH